MGTFLLFLRILRLISLSFHFRFMHDGVCVLILMMEFKVYYIDKRKLLKENYQGKSLTENHNDNYSV